MCFKNHECYEKIKWTTAGTANFVMMIVTLIGLETPQSRFIGYSIIYSVTYTAGWAQSFVL